MPLTLPYIAGLFDGEGSVSLAARRTTLGDGEPVIHYLPTVSIAQANEPFLREIREFVGFGAVCAHRSNRTKVNGYGVKLNRDCFELLWSYDAAVKVAKLLIPHTILKRPQLELIADYWDRYNGYTAPWARWRKQNPEYYRRRDELYSAAEQCRQNLKEVRNAA